ncbi:Extra-large guanine nucleotide-binding protein 1 [Linum grandiflorum]
MPLVDEDRGVQYSFALEYDGPPLPYDLPQAVPINIGEIPVAAVVVSQVADELPLPVVKPLLSSVISGNQDESSAATTVSPTSVIERAAEKSLDSGLLSGELSSSGAIEFSESLSTVRVSEELTHDWGSNLSVLSAEYPSSRVSNVQPASGECGGNGDGRRGQVVTFVDVGSDGEDNEEGEEEEVDNDEEEYYEEQQQQPRRAVQQVKREPQSKGKKGTCYRCFKGNRFTEKEVCLVCDAKYCSNCVLRAMGSMPEGRKCLNCIGYPIDESKRANLGKCSRVLKRLLNDLEVRQIMKAEKFCEANQLPPEYVCVNGVPLCHEELVLLQSCANPPKKLKPGNYWYDKVSGLWGKDGQKPSQIVSAHMNVGGPIDSNASNGNTQVYINGREITKVELRMLQLAGVQCAGNPHFWVNDDGSYQEEGQKNTKGYIWGKGAMKLVCTFLSLPVPSKSSNESEEQVNSLPSRSMPDYLEQRTLLKILLVGYNGSGTSTIFKQAKILYQPTPFTEDERENIKLTIQSNVYGYLGILLEGRDRFEEESSAKAKKDQVSNQTDPTGNGTSNSSKTVYSIGPRLKAFSDWLLKTMVSGNLDAIFPAATREYAPLVEELWKDAAIQATYSRKSELEMLPSVASYFLERLRYWHRIMSRRIWISFTPRALLRRMAWLLWISRFHSHHTMISSTMMNNMIPFLDIN